MLSIKFFISFIVGVFLLFATIVVPSEYGEWASAVVGFGIYLLPMLLIWSWLFGVTDVVVFHKKTFSNLLGIILSSVAFLIFLVIYRFPLRGMLSNATVLIIFAVLIGGTLCSFLKR